jgi:hypothetical protein
VWGGITGTLSDQTDLQTALDAKVPYTGATQDVSLGEYGINVGNLIYDTTPTGIPTEQGATYWDDQSETVALVMNGTIQKIGEDTFYHVKNSTGSTIAKGVAVRFAGTDGGSGKILIAPFLANGTYPTQYYMGITAEAITNGSDGKVYHFGKIRGVNTSAFADGDILYCSTTVAGGFQTTAPSAPNNIVIAAAVINAGNNGTLMVRTTTGSNINTDEGVLLTTPTSGQVLKYNGSLWVNDSVSGAVGYTPANAATTLTINGVTYDLSTSRSWTVSGGISGSGASGQVAYWTGTSAQSGSNDLFWDSANGRLGIGTNAPTNRLTLGSAVAAALQSSAATLFSSMQDTSNIFALTVSSDTGVEHRGVFAATRSRGTLLAPTAVLAGDSIFTLIGSAYDGTATQATALITFAAESNASAGNAPQTINFITGSSGASRTTKAQLRSNGNLILQSGGTFTDGGQRLQVQGTTLLNGNVSVSGSTTASSAIARGLNLTPTLVAAANNDVLVGLDINPTFTNGSFSGVSNIPLRVGGTTVISSGGFGAFEARVRTIISN